MKNERKSFLFAIALFLIGIFTAGGNSALGNNAPHTPSDPQLKFSDCYNRDPEYWVECDTIPEPDGNGFADASWFVIAPSWMGGDPDGGPVTYKLYLKKGDCDIDDYSGLEFSDINKKEGGDLRLTIEESGDVERIETQDHIFGTENLGNFWLDFCTCYYWKVVATDSNGAKSEGPIWKIRTRGIKITAPNRGDNEAILIGENYTIKWRLCNDLRYPYNEDDEVKILLSQYRVTSPGTCGARPEFIEIGRAKANDLSFVWNTSGYKASDDCAIRIVTLKTIDGKEIENGSYGSGVFSMVTVDGDDDDVSDDRDNCPEIANFDQADCDGDGRGDFCEEGISGEISVAEDVLWPPNHKYVDVGLNLSNTSSSNQGPLTIELTVCSDEREDSEREDIEIKEDAALLLRAERLGTSNGRVYTITAQIEDCAGNKHTSTTQVKVPKNNEEDAQEDQGSGYCTSVTFIK